MKFFWSFIFYTCFLSYSYSQINHVYAGGELVNYGTIDISFVNSTSWSSEKSFQPGYYSIVGNGSFTGYSDQANFNGYVKKYGNTPFVFPVGNGNDLRTIEISKPHKATDAYAVAWIQGDPSQHNDFTYPFPGSHSIKSIQSPITQVSRIGQWDWQVGHLGNLGEETTGNGEGLTITASIPDMTSFADPVELRMVGWNGMKWIDLSGKPTATGNKEDSKISGTMIPGISAIAIGKITSPDFVIYPNPVINYNDINIQFKSSSVGSAHLIIYDVIGKKIFENIIQYNNGINTIPVNVKTLSNGSYFINLISTDGTVIGKGKRFIKQ